MTPTRRRLMQGAAALWSALAVGGTMGTALRSKPSRAGVPERKFLFLFAGGGWDATPLDPKYGGDGLSPILGTDMDPDTFRGELGNLSWSAGEDRPAMDAFFARWINRTALIRGVNVHSAGHSSGRQWMMTGTSASSVADWPTTLAAHSANEYPMPHVVFSGPAFGGSDGAALVRGGGGTLLDLMDGSIVGASDNPAPVVPTPSDAMADALVYERALAFADSKEGLGKSRAEDLLASLDRAEELEGRRFEAGLADGGRDFLDQMLMATEIMRLGLSRCAMVGIPGGWDTHGGNQNVGPQMDVLFDSLDQLMTHLATTPGRDAEWLIDEVTIVATSELGRTPMFNGAMGRDHWPYTSMMALGSGIRGNTVCGATDDRFISVPVDLANGQAKEGGDLLGTENVGAALLKLGGLDPEIYRPGVKSLDGLIR